MKKIFTLFSLLMITVVAMAADLTTGVTFKGTWADTDGGYTPTEGEIKVTKTDDGLKFEVKNHVFNGYAFPDYTVDYKIDVTEDGSFNDESGFAHAVLGGNASTEGNAIMNAYWQMIKGSVDNKSIDLYIKYLGANMDELIHVTFKAQPLKLPTQTQSRIRIRLTKLLSRRTIRLTALASPFLLLSTGRSRSSLRLSTSLLAHATLRTSSL